MNGSPPDFVHRTAFEVYGAFLDECVMAHVREDRVGAPAESSTGKIDGRPVRLVTISGKGGWSDDPVLRERWAKNDNISLLDHALSVARGALMFWLADAPRPWSNESDLARIERLAWAVVCIGFLHDIDKDLGLRRGEKIREDAVAERMHRYGIDEFLRHRLRISPAAMLNYIEEVEGTQAARSPTAPDFDRRIAAACRYIELADKLEGLFTSRTPDGGIDGVLASLRDPGRWPVLQDPALKEWDKVEIHDHLHVFLLDRFQRALSTACTEIAGRLPLIEIVHDGRLLSVIPQEHASAIKDLALDGFLQALPYRLRFSVNNRLACEFVGGAASWQACRDVMRRTGDWRPFVNLLALPRPFAGAWRHEIDELFEAAGMSSSWSPLDDGAGATVKPALEYPGGRPLRPGYGTGACARVPCNRAQPRGRKSQGRGTGRQRPGRGVAQSSGSRRPEGRRRSLRWRPRATGGRGASCWRCGLSQRSGSWPRKTRTLLGIFWIASSVAMVWRVCGWRVATAARGSPPRSRTYRATS